MPDIRETIDHLPTSAADVLRDFLQRLDRGEPISRERLLEQHPTVSQELITYFAVADMLNGVATQLHETLEQTPSATDVTLARNTSLESLHHTGVPFAPPAPPAPAEIRSFGDYELLETIARGGMGVVYKARQKKLNRIVAIKMILSGQFADQHQIDRFYAEAEAAANLRHPNIVAVHEIGVADGQHFFSMDFIEGKSLADIVRDHPLSARQAAEYMRCISETMQFAHERGILHRDLKPSNVLVDKRDEPLITDFGLAKQVSGESQLTVTGAVVGTPSYMPPEQASGRSEVAAPQSDIYSLGAILYELLTGHPPFRAATPYETIRQVLEMEPVSPRLLNPGVPRDLETICLKCLQKEPSRRYSTAAELAAELTRFIEGKPIMARPVSTLERFWRLCYRNPGLSTAIGSAILGVLVALVAVSIAFVTTRSALQESEESYLAQMDAVNDLFTRVSEDTLLRQPGMQVLRKDLLQTALAYYERLLERRGTDPRLQNEIAAAHFRIGVITGILESPQRALPHFLLAKQMQSRLLGESPRDAERLLALGNTLNALGNASTKMSKLTDALSYYDQSIQTRARLVALTNNDSANVRLLANAHMNKGLAFADNGRPDEAWTSYEIAQQLRQEALQGDPDNEELLRDFAKGQYNLGTHLGMIEQAFEDAQQYIKNAAEILDRLVAEYPQHPDNQRLAAVCYLTLGDLSAEMQNPDDARQWYDEAHQRMRTLTSANPNVIEYQMEYASLLMNIGDLEQEYAAVEPARDAFDKACRILQPLVEQYPNEPRLGLHLALAQHAVAVQQLALGDIEPAHENLHQSRDRLLKLETELPRDSRIPKTLKSIEKLLASGADN